LCAHVVLVDDFVSGEEAMMKFSGSRAELVGWLTDVAKEKIF
jgi:hypothetical protein